MKRILLAFFLNCFFLCVNAQSYDVGEKIISSSHLRSTYYFPKDTNVSSGESFEKFIANADRSRPVVIHSHGCSGVMNDEYLLKDFYTSLGFNFVLLDFIKRGNTTTCTHLGDGNLSYKEQSQKYTADLKFRLPARVKELEHHINLLRENGFKTIFATGHSEGGMVVQILKEKVEGIVIHSMSCIPGNRGNSENRYLHLVSTNDPLLIKTQGREFGCTEKPNFTVELSNVSSHGALADPAWRGKIREFLGTNIAPK